MAEISLFKDLIPGIDQNVKELWDALDDEQKKAATKDFWTLNRYISSASPPKETWQKGRVPTTEEQEHFVILVNELYNKNYFIAAKHPKLMWLLLCACSHESQKLFFHEWIPLKKGSDNKRVNFLMTIYPTAKQDDLEVLASIMDVKQLKQLAKDHGYDNKQINDLKL
jgi:hypothetical protein